MNYTLIAGPLMAVALMALPVSASAQNANAGSASQSGVIANIQGAAGAQSNNTFTSPDKTEIETVPSVSAPGVITAHQCALGVSGGLGIMGGGVSFGGSYVDENCQRISQAAALNTLAGREAAIIHLAQIPDVCKSLRAAGTIGADSQCGDAAPKRSVSSSGSTRPVSRPNVAYSKCEFRADGAILVGVNRGGDKALAVSQCKAALR